MKRRRRKAAAVGGGLPPDQDGIMDVLANLVGVLTLVAALSAIVVVNASLKIRTPLAQETYKEFVVFQAGEAGIWDLQPARDLGNKLRRAVASRVSWVCLDYDYSNYFYSRRYDINCIEKWTKSINEEYSFAKSQIKSALVDIIFDSDRYFSYNIGNSYEDLLYILKSLEIRTQRSGKPTYAIEDLEKDDNSLRRRLNQAAAENKAIYVILEKEGFTAYQKIRSIAAANNLQVGWEPWGAGEPVFWVSEGRSMNVQ